MSIRALVILAEGFEEIEAITPIDILKRAGIATTTAALVGDVVTGSHGISVRPDIRLVDAPTEWNAVILPGGMPGTTNLAGSDRVLDIVRKTFAARNLCAAICAAPLVLNRAGILNGINYTCYPGIQKDIPDGIYKNEKVIIDQNIITSQGAGTSLEFALAVVEYLLDTHAADVIAKKILFQ